MTQQEIQNRILEICPVGMVALNKQGNITYANQEAEKILGLTKKELSKLTYDSPDWKITDLNGNKFATEHLPFHLVITHGQPVFNIEHAIQWPNGKRVYLSINASPLRNDQSEIEGVIATIQDITDRVIAEEKLQQSEKQYQNLFNNLIDEVHVWKVIKDKNNSIQSWELIDVNVRALKSWGKTKEEVVGKNAIELFGDEAIRLFRPIVQQIFDTNQPYSWEYYFEPTQQYLAMDSIPFGEYFISTGKDITDRIKINNDLKTAKDKAEQIQQQLKQTQSLAKVGGWEFDLASGLFLFNDNFFEIFKSSVDKIGGYQMSAEEYVMRFVYANDREIFQKEIEKAVEANDPEFSGYLEHRILYEDKGVGFVGVRYFIQKSNEGHTVKLYGFNQDITEKKKLELDLISAKVKAEENEEKLLEAQALSHVGSWEYNAETDTVTWSKELYNIFERRHDLPAPRYSEQQSFYTKESFELLDHAVHNCVQNQIPYNIELDIITYSGSIKQIISKGQVKRDKNDKITGCYGTAQDITEKKKLEIDLIRAKERAEDNATRYHGLIANLETGVVVHNQYTSIILCNSRATELLGLSEDQMRGKVAMDPYWKFIYEDNSTIPVEDYPVTKVISTKRPLKNKILGVSIQNTKITWLIVNGFPVLDSNGKISEVIISFNDITELKLAGEQVLKAKEKAEVSDRLKTSFLQNLSHEIRTPLNAISGFAQILENSKLSDESRSNYTSLIQSSSSQLLSIVSDILIASTLEKGQEKITIKELNINSVLSDLYSLFKSKAESKNLKLNIKLGLSNDASFIETDETKLRQILTNLLNNALKFTKHGEIEFGYSVKENTLQFYTKDTGIGIKTEMHEVIFDRFRQADSSIAIEYGGNGLGLSISKEYVKLLGGTIWVQSEQQKGSTFYFTIPYRGLQKNEIKNRQENLTILVAEDEALNFMVIEGMLMNLQATLIHAKDGQEAVDLFMENPSINLVLMDIKMPGLTGDQAAIAIRSMNSDIPIIAQSGYAFETEKDKYTTIFNDYITKPINEHILIQKILKYSHSLKT